jgi:hypothetical protein
MCKYRYAMLVKAWQQENGEEGAPEAQHNAVSLAMMPKQQVGSDGVPALPRIRCNFDRHCCMHWDGSPFGVPFQ